MKNVVGVLAGLFLSVWATGRGSAEFTSLQVFGDGASTTTDSPGPPEYFGNRYCNGRVWVEVLAQWQGIPLQTNRSFYGHLSGVFTGGVDRPDDLLDNIAVHVPPADVSTALYVVWVCDADLVEFLGIDQPPWDPGDNSPGGDLETWATLVADSVANHQAAIEALYGKGVRNIVLPLAVDVTIPPEFNLDDPVNIAFFRARVTDFNEALQAMTASLQPTLPGLRIWMPDTFSFFESVIADPAAFGAVNPLVPPGTDPDLYAVGLDVAPLDLQGPGADHVFWDPVHPTARIQMHLADLVQQLLSPPVVKGITKTATGVDLVLHNVPVGRDGMIEGSDNLSDWYFERTVTATATSQVEGVSISAPERYFRVAYPVVWTWP